MVTGGGLIQLPQALERSAKVDMRVGVVRLHGYRLTVAGDRLIQLS